MMLGVAVCYVIAITLSYFQFPLANNSTCQHNVMDSRKVCNIKYDFF